MTAAVSQQRASEQVLILAPTGRDARLASDALTKAGFLTRICATFDELCTLIDVSGAALIAEEALKADDLKTLTEILGKQEAWSDFPFVVFTSSSEDSRLRLRADNSLGLIANLTILERPVRIQTMISAVNSVLRARRRQYQVRDLIKEVQSLNAGLEKRVLERTAELQEANEELEAFAYSVSHDLRAPLRAIHSFSEMLLDGHTSQLDAEGKDYLGRILKASKYMDALTQDLLAYSRLSRAEFPLQRVSLEDCVSTVTYQISEDVRTKKADIVVQRPLPEVLAHVAPLEQIIGNLLSNALKFSRPNVPIQIRIRAQQRSSKVRVWVEDNGIGISPEYHERIFRLFERLNPATMYPGTGMGLAIVKKAVERMGGTVGLESVLNEGCKFWFELPKAETTPQA